MKERRTIAIACVVLAAVALYLKGGSLFGALGVLSHVLQEMAGTLLLIGTALLGRAIWLWHRAAQIAQWPTAAGSITTSRVESSMRQPLTTYRPVRSRWYRARVTYAYTVNGKHFDGDQVRMGSGGWERDERKARIVLEPYAVGTPVLVHYNPDRPSDSALEPGLGPLWRQAVALACACLALGAYGLMYGVVSIL